MPSIVENEKLFPLAANALTNFSYGLVLLLISAILVFISDWSSFVKDLFKVINISEWKILKIDYSFYAIFLSGICSIASLYLFVSAILSTTFAINNLVQWKIFITRPFSGCSRYRSCSAEGNVRFGHGLRWTRERMRCSMAGW